MPSFFSQQLRLVENEVSTEKVFRESRKDSRILAHSLCRGTPKRSLMRSIRRNSASREKTVIRSAGLQIPISMYAVLFKIPRTMRRATKPGNRSLIHSAIRRPVVLASSMIVTSVCTLAPASTRPVPITSPTTMICVKSPIMKGESTSPGMMLRKKPRTFEISRLDRAAVPRLRVKNG